MPQELQNAGQAAGRPDLFVCHTAYQTFISCIRAMRAAQKPDIVLASGVLPGAGALAALLLTAGRRRRKKRAAGRVQTEPEEAAVK